VVKGSPNEIFSDTKLIRSVDLRSPRITHLFEILRQEDNLPIDSPLPLTISQARKKIHSILNSTANKDSGKA
jgi:cobalt/nickel transport system ATP-binding protein